jgi:hypothetical protein
MGEEKELVYTVHLPWDMAYRILLGMALTVIDNLFDLEFSAYLLPFFPLHFNLHRTSYMIPLSYLCHPAGIFSSLHSTALLPKFLVNMNVDPFDELKIRHF